QPTENFAAIAQRGVDLELDHFEEGRARGAITPADGRRRSPADGPVLDIGDDDVVGVLAIVHAHQRAALEALDAVDARLAGAQLDVEREQGLGSGRLLRADPDVVAPATFIQRPRAQGRLVPAVLHHALGARGVLGLHLLVRLGAVSDAHDVAGLAAV